jgi:hypothetical protein
MKMKLSKMSLRSQGMGMFSKSASIHTLLLVFLTYYIAAGIGADFVHNHEFDVEFHDNCPACRWQAMYQDDYLGVNSIHGVLNHPLKFTGFKNYIQLFILPSDGYILSCPSRAPPFQV